MADAAARGSNALAKSDFPLALSEFTKASIEIPTSPDFRIQRSIAFTRIKPTRHDLALKDAEYAVLFAQKRAKREKIQAAQQRRVVSLYGLGRYADAQFILSTMERWRPADNKPAKMEGDMWKARVETKLKALEEPQQVTAKEYPEIGIPTEAELKAELKAQLRPDGSYIFPEDVTSETIQAKTLESSSSGTTKEQLRPQSTTSTMTKIRHEWYQNPQNVTLTLYAKGVAKDKAQIDIKNDSVSVSFPHPANPSSTFDLSVDPLFALIDSSHSKATIMSTKIEITLKKAVPGQKWHNLEGTEPLTNKIVTNENISASSTDEAAPVAAISTLDSSALASDTQKAPSYPTSSRSGPKNWDKVADDLHAQSKVKKAKSKKSSEDDKMQSTSNPSSEAEDVDSDFEGGDAVDGFFKKLYAGADEDTRRAMMKSFYESNGTALSTNWSEVGKGKVEEVKSKDD
ncbi:uncharacterized protein A1O9_01634 [Exophiala aquamarina CBS 119918]|uniref:SGS-domain-containing protein n=1 Tax=Exophiala aquamarina CBS 119918 TaxID=1182545 RepID=A0A072PUX1_9EURO|nr:uncharacterized protein A1O9_01634 [Exophiala aquamarina CBS 119918]KEF63656.1 hypothetical protein A1O9_01634 [Exophiala aquamarina CBS 119918]